MITNPLGGRKRPNGSHIHPPAEMLEHQVFARLMLAYPLDRYADAVVELDPIEPQLAADFAVSLLTWEADRALREVEALLQCGYDIQAVFLDLLAPAARQLGTMWEEDECDFVEVTMGLWRLQEVMREIASVAPPIARSLRAPARALFSPMPGDQHGFGALMIDDVFARAGWDSEAMIDPQRRELLTLVSQKSFDLVGLTITTDSPSSTVQSLIRAIRTVSANPSTSILIGGRMVNANPEIAEEVGADGTATDAFAALEVAERLVTKAGLHLNPAP
ncbi:cobalamin B12-binding domain-containing protein [Alteriqipengyuania sp. 357]